MIRNIRQHPGVFIGGMVTYAIVAHWVLPKFGGQLTAKAQARG